MEHFVNFTFHRLWVSDDVVQRLLFRLFLRFLGAVVRLLNKAETGTLGAPQPWTTAPPLVLPQLGVCRCTRARRSLSRAEMVRKEMREEQCTEGTAEQQQTVVSTFQTFAAEFVLNPRKRFNWVNTQDLKMKTARKSSRKITFPWQLELQVCMMQPLCKKFFLW